MQADHDLHRRIQYRRNFTRVLSYSLMLLCLPLFVFAMGGPSDRDGVVLATWAGVGLGCAGVAWAAWRMFVPGRPILELFAEGLVWHSGVGYVHIPWNEVEGVETVTYSAIIPSLRRSFQKTFKDITMVLVSREFYLRNIEPGSTFMRGPHWDIFLRPKGDLYQIALHHETFGVEGRDVRGPIEARWLAFRDKADRPSSSRAEPMRFGGGLDLTSPLPAAKVAVPLVICLVLLGNILSAWETPGQTNSRIQREERAARDREINAQFERDRQAREQMWQRFDQRFEESRQRMDRMSGVAREPEPAAVTTPP